MITMILSIVSVVLLFGSVSACFKWGQDDGICDYDYKD